MKSKEQIITEMCLTSNHSYGLDDKTDDSLTSKMARRDKECLYSMMSQLYEHHIQPIFNEVKELEIKLFAIVEHLNIWASKKALFDEGEFSVDGHVFECLDDYYYAGDEDGSISFARALLESINDFKEVFPPDSFILMDKDYFDKMESDNKRFIKELDHWKNNHSDMVKRAEFLHHRTDLPAERISAYEKMKVTQEENNKLKEGIKQEAAYSQKWADEHAGTDRGLRHQERADRLMELLK